MQKYIIIIASVLILGLTASTVYFYREKEQMTKSVIRLSVSYNALSDSYRKLVEKENYSISLHPTIETKISSVLGSSRQITFQYFFSMDGNSIKLQPDSTLLIRR
jgi:hypothetical protein